MIELVNKIPNDKYSWELRNEFLKISRSHTATEEIRSLFKLVRCELSEEAFRKLVSNDHFTLPEIQTENIEVLARINDSKFILGDKDKLNCIQRAVEQYLEIYRKINDLDYLIRTLELIRKIKSVFEPQLPRLEDIVLQILPKLESSYYQLRLTKASIFLIQDSSSKILVDHFIKQIEMSFERNGYDDASNYIQALNNLGHWDNNEYKLQAALCLERKADHYVSQKEPQTYCPNILSIYIEALKEIKGISVAGELKNRLHQKIRIEQKTYSEMLEKTGFSAKSELDIAGLVADQNVVDFKSGFSFLLQFPIIEFDLLKAVHKKPDKNYLWRQFFDKGVRITDKGTVSGISDLEIYDLNFAREYFRKNLISIIREVKLIMDIDQKISKTLIAEMVIRSESAFIPKDREHFFIEGIYYGFQNDFVTASHILIPQVENSLKHIVELNGRNTTKLSEEIQNDNTLGSVLNVEENGKMLDGLCERDLLLELNSFLVDGNSTNFRNRISHGLITPFEADYFGIYTWWLVLKMMKQTHRYFKIPEKKEENKE